MVMRPMACRCRDGILPAQARFTPRQCLRLGASACEDAELVPLRVGKADPALFASLANVGVSST